MELNHSQHKLHLVKYPSNIPSLSSVSLFGPFTSQYIYTNTLSIRSSKLYILLLFICVSKEKVVGQMVSVNRWSQWAKITPVFAPQAEVLTSLQTPKPFEAKVSSGFELAKRAGPVAV